MFELRQKAKKDSQAVMARRGLPADDVRETRQRAPLQSLFVLQEAIEALEVITLQPSQTAPQQKFTQETLDAPQKSFAEASLKALPNTAILSTKAVQIDEAVATTPRPTRPTSAKSATSRPSSRAGARTLVPARNVETTSVPSVMIAKTPLSLKPPKPSNADSDKTCAVRLASVAALPPVIPPCKSSAARPASPCPSKSAMELDLGIGSNVASELQHSPSHAVIRSTRTPRTPEHSRKSQSLGSLRDSRTFSKQAPHISLPSLPAAPGVPLGGKSVAKMRTGSVGAPAWDISPAAAALQWDSRRLVY